jgi:RNA polymerase sigma-70 factor, ECF subfamily
MVDEQDLDGALAGAVGGDEDAFAVLWRALNPPLLRYLRVLSSDGYEDVASETWLQASRDLPKFRGDAKGFQVWLFRIARNRAVDDARSARRRPVDPVENVPELVSSVDTAEEALTGMATRRALQVIAELPRDQAEAVLLRAVAGLSADQAGKVTGKRAGAVRIAAMRGLRALAKRLERHAPGTAAQDAEIKTSEQVKGLTAVGTRRGVTR